MDYSKTCNKWPLKKNTKIGFQDRLSLNADQKYSAILSTFIKLPFVFKIFVLSIFEWPLKTGFTVHVWWKITFELRFEKTNNVDPDLPWHQEDPEVSVQSDQSLHCLHEESWVLSYWVHSKDWSDWLDAQHSGIQKVLSEATFFSQLWQGFFFGGGGGGGGYSWGGERNQIPLLAGHHQPASKTPFKWPNIECWLGSFVIFQGTLTSIAKKPYILVIFKGVGPMSLPLHPRKHWLISLQFGLTHFFFCFFMSLLIWINGLNNNCIKKVIILFINQW